MHFEDERTCDSLKIFQFHHQTKPTFRDKPIHERMYCTFTVMKFPRDFDILLPSTLNCPAEQEKRHRPLTQIPQQWSYKVLRNELKNLVVTAILQWQQINTIHFTGTFQNRSTQRTLRREICRSYAAQSKKGWYLFVLHIITQQIPKKMAEKLSLHSIWKWAQGWMAGIWTQAKVLLLQCMLSFSLWTGIQLRKKTIKFVSRRCRTIIQLLLMRIAQLTKVQEVVHPLLWVMKRFTLHDFVLMVRKLQIGSTWMYVDMLTKCNAAAQNERAENL